MRVRFGSLRLLELSEVCASFLRFLRSGADVGSTEQEESDESTKCGV